MQNLHETDFRRQRADRIFATALALFRARGYAATTISEITAAATVSRRTFFNYFPTKESVLARLHGEITGTALEQLRAGRHPSALRSIRAALMCFAEPFEGQRALAAAMLQAIVSSDVLGLQDRADAARFYPALVRRIRRAQRDGELAGRYAAPAIAGHLMAVVTGAMTHWAGGDGPDRLGELLARRLDMALRGVAARGRTR